MDQELGIRSFQSRRIAALAGLLVMTLTIMAAALNSGQAIFPEVLDWPLAIAGAVLGLLAIFRYRCPFCGGRPEAEDVFMHDHKTCSNCGARLK